jgi:hypothetical protein
MTSQPRRPFRRITQSAMMAIVGLAFCVGDGFASTATRHDVRAATIVQLLRFVEWPPASGGGLTIAVVGNTALGAALRQASVSVQPGRRAVTVVDVSSSRALSGVRAAVVVLGAETAMLARRLSARGVVTVGDGECPEEPGLMLNLLAPGGRYRFSANPAAAAQAGVNLSSRLLRLARIIN